MCANSPSQRQASMTSTCGLAGRGLLALAVLALLGAPAGAEAPDPVSNREVKHFVSGGKEIAVDCFSPTRRGKHPVLITLHAVDGVDGDFAKPYHAVAKMYANQGYVVHLVHYFERTGATKQDVDGYRKLFLTHFKSKEPRPEDLKRIKELSDTWSDVVRDALKFAKAQPNVDDERVVLVGFSLGGCLALSVAARPEVKLAAVVEFFGTLPRELRASLEKMPPTLIFHGEEDKIIPVDEAYALIGLLVTRKLEYEARILRGVGHMFVPPGGKQMREVDFLAAKFVTDAFLKQHLTRREVPLAGK
jgi:dienelactone hydrolase